MAAAKKGQEDEPKVDWKLTQVLAALPETTRGIPTPIYASGSLNGVITYSAGNLVFIRNVKNPGVCDTFQNNDHKGRITVASVSPNGEWIASGDEKGTVLIWGSRPGPHLVKLKMEANKYITDLCWSPDSQRVIAVGDGQEAKARAFTYDSGNSTGAIDGHAKKILTVTHKPNRPFRVATGAEDLSVNFYEGAPYKWITSFGTNSGGHDRFPNCVRYNPTGSHYISVGSDSKIFIYDGKDGKMVKKVDSKDNHKSAIMSVAWNATGTQFMTAALDKTVKLWDFDAKNQDATFKQTFTFGAKSAVPDMQLACLWAGDEMLSISTSGAINYLDPKAPDAPKLVLQGHQHPPRALSVDRAHSFAYTCDDDGLLAQWDLKTGAAKWFNGCMRPFDTGSKPLVSCAVNCDGSKVVSVGNDNNVRFNDVKSLTYNANSTALGGSPTGLATGTKNPDLAVVTLAGEKVVVVKEGAVLSTTAIGFRPLCVAIKPGDKEVAVGGYGAKVQLFALGADGKLTAGKTMEGGHTNRVVSIQYSPDGGLLFSGDSMRAICIWKDEKQQNPSNWTFHTATITGIAFSPSGALVATCGSDQDVLIWSDTKTFESVFQRLQLAHPNGVSFISFIDEHRIITAGEDRAIRIWDFKPSTASSSSSSSSSSASAKK